MTTFRIIIHGGAGVISKENTEAPLYIASLQAIVREINAFVKERVESLSAIDIVEFAIKKLEDDPLFNAGRGGVYAENGIHELEASIMDGSNLKCGAASMITKARNPISVARTVMEKTIHNYVIGHSAEQLAIDNGLDQVDNSYFDTPHRHAQFLKAKSAAAVELDESYLRRSKNDTTSTTSDKTGTVGCVVYFNGKLAAGTSTGGMTNKLSGRVGDSPIIGAGTYADSRYCAVSCTGVGEEFMRFVAAYDIIARMQYGNRTLAEAVEGLFADRLPADIGGVITLDKDGNPYVKFNTIGMFRGILDSEGMARVGIWEDEISFAL